MFSSIPEPDFQPHHAVLASDDSTFDALREAVLAHRAAVAKVHEARDAVAEAEAAPREAAVEHRRKVYAAVDAGEKPPTAPDPVVFEAQLNKARRNHRAAMDEARKAARAVEDAYRAVREPAKAVLRRVLLEAHDNAIQAIEQARAAHLAQHAAAFALKALDVDAAAQAASDVPGHYGDQVPRTVADRYAEVERLEDSSRIYAGRERDAWELLRNRVASYPAAALAEVDVSDAVAKALQDARDWAARAAELEGRTAGRSFTFRGAH